MTKNRIEAIDFLRTIAVFIMIIANSAPYLLNVPHNFWLRIFCSLAAPLFIFLSGYSFYLSFSKNTRYKNKFIQTFYLLISAILVDVFIWGIIPFQTFDILYLIAFSQIINTLLYVAKPQTKLSIALFCVFSAPLVENYFGYRFYNSDKSIESLFSDEFNFLKLVQFYRFFIDGWFPVLPWLSFAILGSLVAEISGKIALNLKILKWLSSIVLINGLIMLYFLINPQAEREGYLELFYPPSLLFILTAFAFIIAFYSFTLRFNLFSHSKFYQINVLGRNSLLIYLFHAFIISCFFDNYFNPSGELRFVFFMFLFIGLCYLIAFLAEMLYKKGYLKHIHNLPKSILGLK